MPNLHGGFVVAFRQEVVVWCLVRYGCVHMPPPKRPRPSAAFVLTILLDPSAMLRDERYVDMYFFGVVLQDPFCHGIGSERSSSDLISSSSRSSSARYVPQPKSPLRARLLLIGRHNPVAGPPHLRPSALSWPFLVLTCHCPQCRGPSGHELGITFN